MSPATTVAATAVQARRRVVVTGVVQGVGFRPFVYGLATALGLTGFVGNDDTGVFVEIEGDTHGLGEFVQRLTTDAPPLARIDTIAVHDVATVGDTAFAIAASVASGAAPSALVPADVALCADCRRELHDPADRRFHYPFVNCTNCGPRFTIVEGLPYDRPATTMATFPMCDACAAEYHDPTDRRFHAQPVACPACGPRVWLHGDDANPDPIGTVRRLLAAGRVVAIKGVGGFHLACDATSAEAVARLRALKHRPAKPFAVMVADLDAARVHADVSDAAAMLLAGPQAPIVLLPVRAGSTLAARVAPGNGRVGLMLPYSPLHELLFAGDGPRALVMTSGNVADEPIAYDNDDALARLGHLADAFLLHDRPIARPCDDSVVAVVDGAELPVRRSRGWAPYPVRLPFDVAPVLAVGGEIKTTFCLARGPHAWLSQHIGDMGNLDTLRAFEASVASLERLYGVVPAAIVSDRHPGYLTARWAGERAAAAGVAHLTVQHHHAHVAALLAEHGRPLDDRIVAFAFDGTGYGDDGTIWGGEVLVGGYAHVERAGHLAPVPLPGGDAAVRHPARVALSHLRAAGIEWSPDLPAVDALGDSERRVLGQQLDRNVACIPTSSMGRLFDAVAALVGVCSHAGYEAQPAIELEGAADRRDVGVAYAFAVGDDGVIDAAPVWRALVADVRAGVAVGALAMRFHRAVAAAVVASSQRLRAGIGLTTVGLTGGVFQNVLLTELCGDALTAAGFTVLHHRAVPPNDGGLALGQAAVAGARLLSASTEGN